MLKHRDNGVAALYFSLHALFQTVVFSGFECVWKQWSGKSVHGYIKPLYYFFLSGPFGYV